MGGDNSKMEGGNEPPSSPFRGVLIFFILFLFTFPFSPLPPFHSFLFFKTNSTLKNISVSPPLQPGPSSPAKTGTPGIVQSTVTPSGPGPGGTLKGGSSVDGIATVVSATEETSEENREVALISQLPPFLPLVPSSVNKGTFFSTPEFELFFSLLFFLRFENPTFLLSPSPLFFSSVFLPLFLSFKK